MATHITKKEALPIYSEFTSRPRQTHSPNDAKSRFKADLAKQRRSLIESNAEASGSNPGPTGGTIVKNITFFTNENIEKTNDKPSRESSHRQARFLKDFPEYTLAKKPSSAKEPAPAKKSVVSVPPAFLTKESSEFFRDCALTEERLKQLGERWLDINFLQRLLLYCRPFVMTFEGSPRPTDPNSKTLMTVEHPDLYEYLIQNGNWDSFYEQMSKAWPVTFGSFITIGRPTPIFLWQDTKPHLDNGTSYVCRKSEPNGSQPLLEELFCGTNIHLHPSDDMLWQIMPTISVSILTMPTAAFLEGLFVPTHTSNIGSGTLMDWFPIQNTTPVLYSTGDFKNGNWFCIRFNMRACVPDEKGHRVKHFKNGYGMSPESLGFPLRRQAARISGLSKADQFAIERLVSVAVVLRKRYQAGAPSTIRYTVVAWLDYLPESGGNADGGSLLPVLSDRIDVDLDLKGCGAGGAGLLQFLIVLTRAIDHWRNCWDTMMTKIDDMISVQLQDTLDKRRWKMLMFDDSFQLSEQYFTVLQLLRIFQDWIGEMERGFEDLKRELFGQFEAWLAWRQIHAPEDEDAWPLDMNILEDDFEKVRDFFKLRVNPLKERIQRKKNEVESLRDGLFNAASLREALKAKTLNLFIGVFTVVTVFFTPLSFITAFWAIPFMTENPQTAPPVPSGFTTSFVAVPMLTYILSAAVIVWVWSRSSRSFKGFVFYHTWDILDAVSRNAISVADQLRKVRFGRKARNGSIDRETYEV